MVALALLLACGLLAAGVRAGAVAPPDVDVGLGDARLIGRTSVIPYCSQLIGPDCVGDDPVPPQRVYTLWAFIRTERGSWRNPEVRRIFSLPLTRPRTLP
jgi:hypothetical protein